MITSRGDFYHFMGFNPDKPDRPFDFRLRKAHALGYYLNGQEAKYYELGNIDEVVLNPTAIFEGLKREGAEQGICYCGKPKRRYTNGYVEIPVPAEMVFAVYVTGDGIIFQWRFELADTLDPDLPENWKARFDKPKWKHS
jgi:hypothetical protein